MTLKHSFEVIQMLVIPYWSSMGHLHHPCYSGTAKNRLRQLSESNRKTFQKLQTTAFRSDAWPSWCQRECPGGNTSNLVSTSILVVCMIIITCEFQSLVHQHRVHQECDLPATFIAESIGLHRYLYCHVT